MNPDNMSMTIKNIINESYGECPYNPFIADVLYKTSYLESWGSGMKRIIEACRKQNVPDPEWSMSGGFVTVTFRRNNQIDVRKDSGTVTENSETGQENSKIGQESQETRQENPKTGQVPGQLTRQERKKEDKKTIRILILLSHFSDDSLSMSDLMKEMGKINRDSFMQNYIHPAMEQGLIAQTHPDTVRHRNQTYYLTEKGKEVLSRSDGNKEK